MVAPAGRRAVGDAPRLLRQGVPRPDRAPAPARDGSRSPGFFDDVRVLAIPEAARSRGVGRPSVVFMNVNTPEELERAPARARPGTARHGPSRQRARARRRSRRSTCCRARWRKRSTSAWCRTSCSTASRSTPPPSAGLTGARLVRITAPADQPWARVEVRSAPGRPRPALLVDVEMSPLSVPELAFVQITDPAGAPLRDRPRPGRARHPLRHRLPQRRRGAPRPAGRARARAGAPRAAPPRARARVHGGLLRADRQGDLPHRAALLPLRHPLRASRLRLPDGAGDHGVHPRRSSPRPARSRGGSTPPRPSARRARR